MRKKPKSDGAKEIEYTKHQGETRVNIPTQELKDFVAPDEVKETRKLYPRDPALDPQLVWKGKDEQDREDLAVPTVPIYIQEKIHPSAIIENIRLNSPRPSGGEGPGGEEEQPDLFGDFNGIEDFEKKIDFYHHEGHWTNRMILGDSLLVMNSLAEKEGLKGKVQMIYIDPPYGIKFGSNWQVSTRKRQVGDKAEDATRQPEQVRAFRDTWKLGIHSYLSYLRDRLVVARELLTESGSVFVQIGDENVHLVRSVMDEVFGSECHVVTILVKKKGSQKSTFIDPVNDYVLWFSKSPRDATHSRVKYRLLFTERAIDAETVGEYRFMELPDGTVLSVIAVDRPDGSTLDYRLDPPRLKSDYPEAKLFRSNPLTSGGERANQSLPFSFDGKTFSPPSGSCWKHTARRTADEPCGMERLAMAGRLLGQGTWRFKSYLDDFGRKPLSNWWDSLGGAADPVYVVQTNVEIVKRCMLMTTDPGDLVLDPTCGSGTTAFVAEQWGRRWITVDTSRVAMTLARTRIMAGRFPYYLLADSPEGVQREADITGKVPPSYPTEEDIRKGFVYRRVIHVTSGSVANNPDIHEGMTREEIDRAILKHADTELLYDQPYEDKGRVRVTGPFTVESLAPHRVLETNPDAPQSERQAQTETGGRRFEGMILDNLRKAGVQNTRKGERLKFDSLETFAGTWIHAKGSYPDADGATKTVAVSIGPEFGTVGPDWIKEAAKEAVKGVGFDLLIVCGFSFDGYASEEARQFGALTVLPVRMNNDLSMGDDLLKKTGAGNLFMVFGEPDVSVTCGPWLVAKDGRLIANYERVKKLSGLGSLEAINGAGRAGLSGLVQAPDGGTEALGGDQPYDKLKRALRAEIDEAAWSALYSTKSRPFDKPTTGKIAVKVINHYGDEVLKVYEVT